MKVTAHIATGLVLALSMLLAGCGKKTANTSAGIPTAKNRVEFCADSAAAYVKAQCDFGPRVPNTTAHTLCGDWLLEQLNRRGATVTAQQATLTTFDGTILNARNIIAQFNPDSTYRILLTAHWDCRPWADSDPDPAKHHLPVMGANDGASGVGVLLEIARLIALQNPSIGIDIIFFDAEDWGTNNDDDSWALGTQYWAQHQHTQNYAPAYAILLDMVGAPGASFQREYFSMAFAPGVVNNVWATAHAAGYGNFFKNSDGAAITDDHLFVNKAGIKCIDIVDYRSDDDGGFFEQWHTTADTFDNIDPATLKAVGQTLTNLIYQQ